MNAPDPIDPELAELFRREPLPQPPDLARARVLGRLQSAIPAMDVPLPSHKAASLLHGTVVGSKVVALVAGAFVLGGLAGGATIAAVRPSGAPRVVYVDRGLATTAPPAQVSPSPAVGPALEGAAADPVSSASVAVEARPASPSPAPVGSGEALGMERLLIEDARTKLANGDPKAALARLQEHARRFPRGRLDEEREALAVQALVQAGHFEAARTRAAQLHTRWPESVFWPAVDTTIQSIP